MPKDATPPDFVEKTFANSHKTVKFVKVFFLESFLLYGIDRHTCTGSGGLSSCLDTCPSVHQLLASYTSPAGEVGSLQRTDCTGRGSVC